ncbi:MAG: hypothetical protein KatS3mg100_684 [Candidatus Parcubacteria bacterium]|nr:MAG: hypothetical protein KatS3mg100_684 [Candidatus Parcubacteria bacterium]
MTTPKQSASSAARGASGSKEQRAKSVLEKVLSVLTRLGFAPLKEKQKSSDTTPPKTDKAVAAITELAAHGDLVAQALAPHINTLRPHLASPHPRLFYTLTSIRGGKQTISVLAGHIVGPQHPYTEAFGMFAALEASSVIYPKETKIIRYNSLGDQESLQAYLKEAQGALRRAISALSPSLQATLRAEGPHGIWRLSAQRHPVLFDFPRPFEHLSPTSREMLQEILDILEGNQFPYEIDDLLIPAPSIFSHGVFSIHAHSESNGTTDDGEIAAQGGSLAELFRDASGSDAPTFSLFSFALRVPEAPPRHLPEPPTRTKVFYSPIGKDARAVSFTVVKALQGARIPFVTNIACGRFCDAIANAERKRIPYVVFVGTPEAFRRVAVVRRMEDRAQREVPFAELKEFLSRIEQRWNSC